MLGCVVVRDLCWVWDVDADLCFFFFASRRRHTRCSRDWSSDVCSSDLGWIDNPPKLLRKYLPPQPEAGPDTNSNATTTAETISTNAPAAPVSNINVPSLWDTALDAETLQSATAWLAKAAPRVGSWLFGQVSQVASWFGVLAGLALIPVYAFYFLLEKEGIQNKWSDYLPVVKSGFKDELVFVLNSINDYLIAFFRGQVIVALCD